MSAGVLCYTVPEPLGRQTPVDLLVLGGPIEQLFQGFPLRLKASETSLHQR